MTPGFAVFILMNNYFHDVATAMLLACSVAMAVVVRKAEQSRGPGVTAYLLRLYRGLNGVAWLSVVWIILGGIPRVLTFRTFEWANAVEKHHESGLIAKYIIAFCMMTIGAWLWMRFSRKIRKRAQGS